MEKPGSRPTKVTVLFFAGPPAPWSGFAAYFAHRGHSCYAMPSSDLRGPIADARLLALPRASEPEAGDSAPRLSEDAMGGPELRPVLITAGGDRQLRLQSAPAGPFQAIALLSPNFSLLLNLLLTPPAADLWLGYGALQRPHSFLARTLRRRQITLHSFQGLDADIAFRPGWERVAHALHLWLESRHANFRR